MAYTATVQDEAWAMGVRPNQIIMRALLFFIAPVILPHPTRAEGLEP